MKSSLPLLSILFASLCTVSAHAGSGVYGPFPITVKNYSGSTSNSVSYNGQMARHTLHNSLKILSGKGNGEANPTLKAQMMSYYAADDAGRLILDPVTKGDFKILQSSVDSLSKNKDLKGKTFKGAVYSFPGQMTGPEVIEFMIDKASSSSQGFDPLTGYNYKQLISKYIMGAVFYNQAVDKYLDEKLEADTKPNNKAYKKGTPYTGKEHVWDEAFGYFGAPAHALNLSASEVKGIAKKKSLKVADANKDGNVDLTKEMTFSHAYYAAGFDKSGTDYLKTIVQAFVDGRQLLTDANGKVLTDSQRFKLKAYAQTIKLNWELVIAEAAFKYAGETYEDLTKLITIVESNGNANKVFKDYSKHWSEMKGFLMALQSSGKDLGGVAVQLNRLVGFGPVLLGGNQVTGINSDGDFETGGDMSLGDYQVHMIKVQQVLAENFKISAKQHDATADMTNLLESLGKSKSAEND